jgi:hypothetical protein
VRDAALDRAAGIADEQEDEWTSVSEELRKRWHGLTLPLRKQALRVELNAKFRKRFGFAWDERRNNLVLDPPWPPAREPWQKKGRGLESRARFVRMLDFENQLALPARADGSARFLSVSELTWISILAGNWPPAGRRRRPDAVVRAERELIKKSLFRYGQRPAEALGVVRIRRGPQFAIRTAGNREPLPGDATDEA